MQNGTVMEKPSTEKRIPEISTTTGCRMRKGMTETIRIGRYRWRDRHWKSTKVFEKVSEQDWLVSPKIQSPVSETPSLRLTTGSPSGHHVSVNSPNVENMVTGKKQAVQLFFLIPHKKSAEQLLLRTMIFLNWSDYSAYFSGSENSNESMTVWRTSSVIWVWSIAL